MANARKTLFLWLVLIILFVAFYQLFSVPPDPNAAPVSRPPFDWNGVLLPWAPFLLLFLGFFFFARSQTKKVAMMNEGARLLHEGRAEEALEAFEKFRLAHPKHPMGPLSSGAARLRLWRFEAALVDFEAAQKIAGGKEKRTPLVTWVHPMLALIPEQLALTYALLGRVGDAQRMLSVVPAGKGDPGRMALAEAILLLREGDAMSARARLGVFEVKQLVGTMGALARTLDAWCIEKLTGERRHVDRVALFGATGPEELRKVWPELNAFVERAPPW